MTTPGEATDRQLVLLRHGETQWAQEGRHTGLTDVPLTPRGEELARATPALLGGRRFALVLTSPLQRARRTAELAGLAGAQVETDLVEWDYGGYEGLTTAQIRARVGHPWTVFRDGVVPGATPGETLEEVAARTGRVIKRALAAAGEGDVALVGHGHCLRILTAVFLGQEPALGAQLILDAGSVSVLGWERETAAIASWNRTVAG